MNYWIRIQKSSTTSKKQNTNIPLAYIIVCELKNIQNKTIKHFWIAGCSSGATCCSVSSVQSVATQEVENVFKRCQKWINKYLKWVNVDSKWNKTTQNGSTWVKITLHEPTIAQNSSNGVKVNQLIHKHLLFYFWINSEIIEFLNYWIKRIQHIFKHNSNTIQTHITPSPTYYLLLQEIQKPSNFLN